ncbi:hypothetical protein BDY24DRAFT_283384 [Mrakia frigida]|uniref:uncharacterized protein n=1 Tax=Mrakia frigida TaxID=29902 RepID=UPI003FCBFF2D
METGELSIYDPDKVLAGASAADSTIFQSTKHKGPVRGLDFNYGKKQLLASGSSEGEIFIWDMTSISSTSIHYTPGSTASKPGDITSLAWNNQKEYILASSLSTGYTVIWDLRNKTQIRTLQYAGTGSGGGGGNGGGGLGGRAAMSSVCWHPDNPMSVITASEDDASPIIMVWDLRNSLAPERILSGHDKGVLSVSWCKQDPDLLLSCGKDNRTILWNPQSSEILGELPASNNWAFQTSFNPRNPDILATASFDGKISINSLQSNENESTAAPISNRADGGDLFDNPDFLASSSPGISLKQPPKWLRRPISASFGFGGVLASTCNLPSATGKTQSAVVHLRTVVTEPSIVERAEKLQAASGSKEDLGAFSQARTKAVEGNESDVAAWKALTSLFDANSRNELVTLLGFSKEEVAEQVSLAIANFKAANPNPDAVESPTETPSQASTILLTEPAEGSGESATSGGAIEGANSEFSASGLSDSTKKTEAESEATEPPSLFGDEGGAGTPQVDAGADFLSSLGSLRTALPEHVRIPHIVNVAESSVGATVGSASSVTSDDNLKVTTFKIYPAGESEVDRLITRALVLGDFESAVSLCLSSDRFADAILLAVRGGPDLLRRTQKTYFERRTASLPYLRLFQSIVSDDLTDIVQNADLSEWQEIFVVLCTFAKTDEFNGLAEQLGQRLEHQYRVAAVAEGEDSAEKSKVFRKNATLCYLAARKLEKVVTIWADEMKEEEEAVAIGSGDHSRYTAHAQALQSFIEKVTVFQSATGYVDKDLASPTESEAVAESGARTYKLSSLYERYFEYADLLATQGLLKAAGKFIQMTPSDFRCDGAVGRDIARERFLADSASKPSPAPTPIASSSSHAARPSTSGPYSTYPTSAPTPSSSSVPPPQPTVYTPYGSNAAPSNSSYGAPPSSSYGAPPPKAGAAPPAPPPQQNGPYGSSTSSYGATNGSSYSNSSPYGQPPQQSQQQAPPPPSNSYGQSSYGNVSIPPPPRPISSNAGGATPPIPAAQRRDIPGWNDPPSAKVTPNRTSSAAGKPAPITSPFPNSPGMTPPPQSPGQGPPQHQGSFFPPPPPARAPSSQPPPPPRGGSAVRPPPPANQARPPPPPAARAGPPPHAAGVRAPPPRVASPLGPPGRVLSPSGHPARMPSSNMAAAARGPSSMYSPPQGQASSLASPPSGAYAPPPGARGGAAPPQQARAPPPPAAPAPPPPAPRHPAGDRSHISGENIAIFEQIQFLFDHVRSLPPPNPQIAQELQRIPTKLDILYDRLNNDEVSADLAKKLRTIAKSMENRRLDEAYPFLLNIITNTTFDGLLPAITALKLLMSIAMSPPQ